MRGSTRAGRAGLEKDIDDLHHFGYQQKLRRTIGAYSSFALGFSMITLTTTIFALFANPFQMIGGVAIWLWIPVTLGVLAITAVYGHLSARLPLTGYAYQWSSRLVSKEYGWFTGWTALGGAFSGTASIAVAMGTVFGPEIWSRPTHANVAAFAAVAILAAVVVNIASIRAVTSFNNVGASAELVGTMGLTAMTAIGLFFFDDVQGPGVLLQVGSTTGMPVTATTIGLAALVPVYTLMGWESSAGLAEETHDPRATAPTAMFRSVVISAIAGFSVCVVFAMAIPGEIAATANGPGNALISIFHAHFGDRLTFVMKVVVFVSIFSALLANVTVSTRMVFSLARDHMLPASAILGRVNSRTRTPIHAIILVGAVALFVNLLSSGVISRVVAIVAVTLYGTYLLAMIAVLVGARRGTLPAAPPQYLDLGRWLGPLCWIGSAWAVIVIGYMTLPAVNREAGEYTVYFEVLGLLWFVVHLRDRIRTGAAGPPTVAQVGIDREELQVARESESVR